MCIVTMCLAVYDGIDFAINLNPLTINVSHNIENSQLICNPNELTSFSMMGNIGC